MFFDQFLLAMIETKDRVSQLNPLDALHGAWPG